jgi:hypothetical protein
VVVEVVVLVVVGLLRQFALVVVEVVEALLLSGPIVQVN